MFGPPTGKDGEKRRDPFDGEYIGNIWGWRFSMLGLALIVLMAGLMAYRHYSLDIPFGEPRSAEPAEEMAPDSLIQADTLSQ